MGIICRYCGASSQTHDKCSNCGAPIEIAAQPLALKFDKIQRAVDSHMLHFDQENILRRPFHRLVTNIYVDDMLAFRLISNPKKLGICVVKNNDRILDGMNRCASGSKLSHSDRRYTFGRDVDDMIYSISDIIGNGANISDEKRIKFETKLTVRTSIIWLSIPIVLVGMFSTILGLILIIADWPDLSNPSLYIPVGLFCLIFCWIVFFKPCKTLIKG